MKKRILFLSQWFDPEPTFKGLIFVKELIKLGYDVEVVTGFPNYPGGKLYPGYCLRLIQREVIDGVNITRVPLYPSHDGSALKRILNYVSFSITATLYGIFGAKKADVGYAYHPPLTVGIAASIIKFFRRIPFVYDIQDLWPDTLSSTGMVSNRGVLKIVDWVAKWVYRQMNHIVVLSPGFFHKLVERGVPKEKIDVIYNWCSEKAVTSSQQQKISLPVPEEYKFRILFAGTMGKAQSLETVFAAAEKIKYKAPQVCFIFLGGGIEVENLKLSAQRLGLNNVIFLPRVPMDQVGGFLRAADVLLIHLKKDPLFEITIPSKTQAYMAIGKPILMAVAGDSAALTRAAQCAVEAIPGDAESIEEAVIKLVSFSYEELLEMGLRAKTYYNMHLSMVVGVKHFAKIFDRLIQTK